MDRSTDILIIGGGAAGLMAGRELTRGGLSVRILEGRKRLGGRIHTLPVQNFPGNAEAGAEFIHGKTPITLGLLKEANIGHYETGGQRWNAGTDRKQSNLSGVHWEEFEQQLNELEQDMTLNDFLGQYFRGARYQGLRDSVRGMASGFDCADPDLASALALREEWFSQTENGDPQYRIQGGYSQLTGFLEKEIRSGGGKIKMNTLAREVLWNRNPVIVFGDKEEEYQARKVLITIPTGVLQSKTRGKGKLNFNPSIPELEDAADQIGFGSGIKFLLLFRSAFWKDREFLDLIGPGKDHLGMIFSKFPVPTWWTPFPKDDPMLTGWIGGPPAARLKRSSDNVLLTLAEESILAIFGRSTGWFRQNLVKSKVINWAGDPYSRGSYSYATLGSGKARKQFVGFPSENLFFAGEAFYEGPFPGTVEAALASGKESAHRMLSLPR
ncbi:MAG TPA: NAD(P)/FAD-dependent oxidoreductase [Chitinophagaceae bacterium]|nr:NAD(P)/FAD-dependent oxidoreductase [Chitinophagaceae bacterium]